MPHSILSFIMAWYNLPFTILLAICLLLAALQWLGLGGEHEGDAHADADGGVDHDFDHDFDHDLDHDIDHDVDASGVDHDVDHDIDHSADHDVDHSADHDTAPGLAILAYLGMGRAPLMVILLLLFGSVGLLGWTFNGLVNRVFGVYPGLIFGAVFLGALLIGSYISSRLARAIGRALPPVSTTATQAQALVGRRGTVISPFVDQKYGMVHLRDAAGTLISVFAVIREGEPIRRGEEVVFIEYDPEKRIYEVVRANIEAFSH